jgi:hypothetical protein
MEETRQPFFIRSRSSAPRASLYPQSQVPHGNTGTAVIVPFADYVERLVDWKLKGIVVVAYTMTMVC